MKRTILKSMLVALSVLVSIHAKADSYITTGINGIVYKLSTSSRTASVTYWSSEGNSYTGSVEIPASVSYDGTNYTVKEIGSSAFRGCSGLTSVIIPNSVTSIGGGAFRGCSSLSNITLSNQLNYINEYAFADGLVLNNVVLPESLKSIQNAAFNGDAALSSITFPAALEGIGAAAFANCASLEEVTFNTMHYNMAIGADAFNGSNAISKVKVAHLDSWVSINFSNPEANPVCIAHRLYNAEDAEIMDAEVPEGSTYVNNNVFYNCQNLRSVTLPSSIQIINDNIFYGCTSLTKVVSKATEPPYFAGIDDPAKMNNVFNAADLYVPDASVGSYSADDWWKRFKNILPLSSDTSTGIEGIDANTAEAEWYTPDGRKQKGKPMQKGIYIRNSKKVYAK